MVNKANKLVRDYTAQGYTDLWRLDDKVGIKQFSAVNEDGEVPSHYKLITEGKYVGLWVSNLGGVMSAKGAIVTNKRVNNAGYMCVNMRIAGKPTTVTIAHLVATAWVPNVLGLTNVAHKNGFLVDDRAENLAWVTHVKPSMSPVAVSSIKVPGNEILTDYKSISEASQKTNISITQIKALLRSDIAPVRGLTFCYTRQIAKAQVPVVNRLTGK